jgi:hypothetical protein
LQIFSLVRSVRESHAVRAFHSGKVRWLLQFSTAGIKSLSFGSHKSPRWNGHDSRAYGRFFCPYEGIIFFVMAVKLAEEPTVQSAL